MRKYKIGDHVCVKESNIEWFHKFAGKTGIIIDIVGVKFPYLIHMDDGGKNIWCEVECLVEDMSSVY